MKKIFYILFPVIASVVTIQAQRESNQPIMNLEVTVNGKKFTVRDGDTLNLPDNQIIVKSSDYLTFDYGALKFEYPRNFAFAFEQDFGFKNWTLNGNNFVVMYFEIAVESSLDVLIKEMVNRFGPKNCVVTEVNTQLGDLKLSGKRIDVRLLEQRLSYEMYKIDTDDYKSHFIAFQDSKNEDGSDSGEKIATMEVINRTIKKK